MVDGPLGAGVQTGSVGSKGSPGLIGIDVEKMVTLCMVSQQL